MCLRRQKRLRRQIEEIQEQEARHDTETRDLFDHQARH
jgi:hypothetical protein